jgi:hypothetical protein
MVILRYHHHPNSKTPHGTRARKLQGRVEPAKVISFGDGLI